MRWSKSWLALSNFLHSRYKLGGMLAAAKAAGQVQTAGGNRGNQYTGGKSAKIVEGDNAKISLKDSGISPDLASRAQRIAHVSKEEFERAISKGREKVKLPKKHVFEKEWQHA